MPNFKLRVNGRAVTVESWAARSEIRMRARTMWSVYGIDGWESDPFLHYLHQAGRRTRDHNDRRIGFT